MKRGMLSMALLWFPVVLSPFAINWPPPAVQTVINFQGFFNIFHLRKKTQLKENKPSFQSDNDKNLKII